ncbi:uncharacterized protein LOC130447484 [Diorhabda sublineata]|uniref:uncharacterized protein LOC130447484 n=1 Tax=Diorhabda sublineata TaxID=1163346 RepID=UPI0024E07658|nr:uncharacterized protein LOC130447484 [Diorhabda sublineata]
MFRIIPVIAASCFDLPGLPVELWITILRLLDPKSLLATTRADVRWRNICLGDCILRNRLQEILKMERRFALDTIIDPRKSVSTTRDNSEKTVFTANIAKKKMIYCQSVCELFGANILISGIIREMSNSE